MRGLERLPVMEIDTSSHHSKRAGGVGVGVVPKGECSAIGSDLLADSVERGHQGVAEREHFRKEAQDVLICRSV